MVLVPEVVELEVLIDEVLVDPELPALVLLVEGDPVEPEATLDVIPLPELLGPVLEVMPPPLLALAAAPLALAVGAPPSVPAAAAEEAAASDVMEVTLPPATLSV